MKTTIDIPDALYRQTKIRAVEEGQTLKQIVLRALERELKSTTDDPPEPPTLSRRRRLRPDFARYQAAGAFRPGHGATDSTELISDERDGR